jgi:glycosyltransferase involved in cell wall biosynthesis
MEFLVLSRYGHLGASSRVRFHNFFDAIRSIEIIVNSEALISDDLLMQLYGSAKYRIIDLISAYWKRLRFLYLNRNCKYLWLEKELFPWLPYKLESFLLGHKHLILDIDDAIFHNYDQHSFWLIRLVLGRKIDKLMKRSDAVFAGSPYIADRARKSGAVNVILVPTSVNPNIYLPIKNSALPDKVTVVWIGSPSTVQYLSVLRDTFDLLSENYSYELVIIGASASNINLKNTRFVKWSEKEEAKLVGECDIGIMPLPDTPFERGKCGYKLLQYMSCELPVVASPVGVNSQIVDHGKNGYLADTPSEWYSCLEVLIQNAILRKRLGLNGRKKVQEFYAHTYVESIIVNYMIKIKDDRLCVD